MVLVITDHQNETKTINKIMFGVHVIISTCLFQKWSTYVWYCMKMVGVLDSQQNQFRPAPICSIFKCYDEITGSPLLAVIEIVRFLDIISEKERE